MTIDDCDSYFECPECSRRCPDFESFMSHMLFAHDFLDMTQRELDAAFHGLSVQ